MEKTIELLQSPWIWVTAAALLLLAYGFSGRLSYIDIIGVVKQYKEVFTKPTDFIFFILFPLLLAIGSTLYKAIDDVLANLIAVVLSILTSMVLTVMSMTNERYEYSLEKSSHDLSDKQLKERNQDALAVGTYEMLISIFVLILTFILPILNVYPTVKNIVSFFIYHGFYTFLLNIFIMVRRLFQVYLTKR